MALEKSLSKTISMTRDFASSITSKCQIRQKSHFSTDSKKYTDLILPENSRSLFSGGFLGEIPTDKDGQPLQGFKNAEEGDPVDRFDLENADTSNVTDMSHMFWEAKSFDQDISGWDVSNVTNMRLMFGNAASFNQDISGWDVSNVTNMNSMFTEAASFNQDLSEWDVSCVEDMSHMFWEAESFNQDLSEWDVSNVENMTGMFACADIFNQSLSDWDVSSVENMKYMFYQAELFNQDISTWSWDLSCINEAFSNVTFKELCDQMSYGAFEDRELRKLDEEKIRILVEQNIIGEETALANVI